MNREILFRSWNERHKKFFYFKNGGYYSDEECEFSVYWSFFSWINAEQFTGKTVCVHGLYIKRKLKIRRWKLNSEKLTKMEQQKEGAEG